MSDGRLPSLGSSVVDLQALEDVAECPVCTGTEGVPKVLPCLHTLCLSCISQMLEKSGQNLVERGELCCPMCRYVSHMPITGKLFINKASS